ncbi:hypothetical protein BH23BAC1_BH23BAC1_09870 [soil metagenome]
MLGNIDIYFKIAKIFYLKIFINTTLLKSERNTGYLLISYFNLDEILELLNFIFLQIMFNRYIII